MRVIFVGPRPLPVGIVRWRAPMARLSVLVKATFSFANDDGAMVLADEQEPPCLERPLDGGAPDEVLYPSDFVPMKAAPDVILVGSAYAPEPTERIDATIRIGEWSRTFAVVAGAPARTVPLTAACLRAADGRAPTRVGARHLESRSQDLELDDSFDYAHFNAAHEAQRPAAISPVARIGLRALSPRAASRVLQLPGLRPILYVERDGDAIDRFDPILDTLWIDTERERCVVVFREDFKVSSTRSPDVDRILVTLTPREVEREELLPLLSRNKPWFGLEPPIMTPDAVSDDEADELRMAEVETWEHAPEPALSADEYTRVSAELAEKREPRADTLRRHRLDDDAWTLEERAWLGKLTAGVFSEDERIATDLGERFVAAQDALGKPAEAGRTLADYAELSVVLEDCEDPGKVLALRGLTTSEYMRLDRRFTRAISEDDALAAEYERHVAAARGRRPRDEGEGA